MNSLAREIEQRTNTVVELQMQVKEKERKILELEEMILKKLDALQK
jgi:hypothetical protein